MEVQAASKAIGVVGGADGDELPGVPPWRAADDLALSADRERRRAGQGGRIEPIRKGVIDHADDRAPLHGKPDHDRPLACAVHKVLRPIDGVDEPDASRAGAVVDRLFGNDGIVGEGLRERRDDERVERLVDAGHKVARPLLLHRKPALRCRDCLGSCPQRQLRCNLQLALVHRHLTPNAPNEARTYDGRLNGSNIAAGKTMTSPASPDLTPRPPSDSRVSMTELVLPSHANAVGTMFGGTLMAWIDICAAIAAQRHSRGWVVTASMDQLDFDAPIQVGDVVSLTAQVNFAGRSSMEVGVRVEREVPTAGERVHAARAYLTFVAIDAAGKARPVPPIAPVTDVEHERYEEAGIRKAKRLEAAHARRLRAVERAARGAAKEG